MSAQQSGKGGKKRREKAKAAPDALASAQEAPSAASQETSGSSTEVGPVAPEESAAIEESDVALVVPEEPAPSSAPSEPGRAEQPAEPAAGFAQREVGGQYAAIPEEPDPPSYAPIVTGLGIAVFAWGFLTAPFIVLVGLFLFATGMTIWIKELTHHEP